MVIIYITSINLLSFLIMYGDKRSAIKGKQRVPERVLMLLAALGGAVGIMSGMIVWKHKLSKVKFRIGTPLLLVLHWGIFIFTATR